MAGEKGDLAYLQLNFSSRYRLLRVKVGKGENAKQWMTRPREVPPSGVMSYTFLNDVMRCNCNPDYYAEGFPIHCAQNILKQVTQDLNSFFKALKKWNVAPWEFNGKPKLPEYKHKQGATTFVSSNQECRIHQTKRGNYYCFRNNY